MQRVSAHGARVSAHVRFARAVLKDRQAGQPGIPAALAAFWRLQQIYQRGSHFDQALEPNQQNDVLRIEGVRQVRGEAGAHQVSGCETAYVSGTGGIMSEQSALVLAAA